MNFVQDVAGAPARSGGRGSLLFSFEFCAEVVERARELGAAIGLLFSFEFCPVPRVCQLALEEESKMTCYFLLNFVENITYLDA